MPFPTLPAQILAVAVFALLGLGALTAHLGTDPLPGAALPQELRAPAALK